jgi:hypothetical protein
MKTIKKKCRQSDFGKSRPLSLSFRKIKNILCHPETRWQANKAFPENNGQRVCRTPPFGITGESGRMSSGDSRGGVKKLNGFLGNTLV